MNEKEIIDVVVSNIFAEGAKDNEMNELQREADENRRAAERSAEYSERVKGLSPVQRKQRLDRALYEREKQAHLLQRRLARIEAALGLDPLL
jgi:excinuclease UvrABC nuclease subunit